MKLQVSGWVFRVVQERVWHESQEVRVIDEKNEVAEVTMSVSALEDVVSLVLSWGKHVKVISPKKLLELIRQEVKEMEHF